MRRETFGKDRITCEQNNKKKTCEQNNKKKLSSVFENVLKKFDYKHRQRRCLFHMMSWNFGYHNKAPSQEALFQILWSDFMPMQESHLGNNHMEDASEMCCLSMDASGTGYSACGVFQSFL